MNKRPYFVYFDGSTDIPIQQQVDDPQSLRFIPQAAANARSILGADGNTYVVADETVAPRGSKNIVWSSEGYTSLGVAIPALTANQKKATGDQTANVGANTVLDFSAYRALLLVANLTGFTGGSSPTIQYEIDTLDDTGTPVSIALWKPAALSAAATMYVAIGLGLPFTQAASAPNTAASGFAAVAAPSGVTYYSIPLPFTPQGKFAWTVANAPTAIAWSANLYGIY